ncbi:MAG: (Fe-S)-binding protein [Chloroflexota bacterium]
MTHTVIGRDPTSANPAQARKPFYHIDPGNAEQSLGNHKASPPEEARLDAFFSAFEAILEHSNYRFLMDLYARTSSKCGRCAVACQVYQASGDPRDVPCYRSNLLLDIYRQFFMSPRPPSGSGNGRWEARFLGDALQPFSGRRHMSPQRLLQVIDEMGELFYRCTACRRCKLECPMGIDHGLITHLGRYVLSQAGVAPKGLVVSVREQLEGKTANTSAIPLPALIDNLEFLQEELEEMKSRPITFPVDQQGAEYIFFPAVSDYLMEADTLMGNAAVLQTAGISWTIGSQYYDGINYGLFYDDWVLERIIHKLVDEAHRLQARKILIGECGHAARSARQFVPAFTASNGGGSKNGGSMEVVSILELTLQAVQQGKISLDPEAIPERVTYHDPCNIARTGWIVEQPRQILKSFVGDFVEMNPHGTENYCCGGGGGLVSLDETIDFRMRVSGKTKAEQIAATGAQIVATPCANCKKQLRELMEFYKMPVQIVGVHDLILRAIR